MVRLSQERRLITETEAGGNVRQIWSVGRYAPGAPNCVSHLQRLVGITALKSSFPMQQHTVSCQTVIPTFTFLMKLRPVRFCSVLHTVFVIQANIPLKGAQDLTFLGLTLTIGYKSKCSMTTLTSNMILIYFSALWSGTTVVCAKLFCRAQNIARACKRQLTNCRMLEASVLLDRAHLPL